MNAGLLNPNVHCLALSGTNLFAGTDNGVFLTTDGGTSWSDASAGLINRLVYALAVVHTNLFAGTYGSGVWRRPLSEMITAVHLSGSELPCEFLLQQNYPNPFNPATTIRYALPEAAAVKLVVFNSVGQRVADLVDEAQPAGHHEVRFDGSRLSSGVYFYRLQAGDFVQTKRLMLLK